MGRRASGIVVTGAAIVAVTATTLAGAPARLPDIALDSTLLFHVERAVALLAGFLVVVVTITRAWAGELPAEFSAQGVRYGDVGRVTSDALDDVVEAGESLRYEVVELRRRIEDLEAQA
jgi:hypothetical protein